MPELKALADAGRVEEGAKKVDAVFETITSLDYKPTTAEVYFYRGVFALDRGRIEEGAADIEQAFNVALAAGVQDVPAHASGILVYVVGERLGDYEGAQRWIRLAASTAEAWGNQPKIIASLEINIGVVESAAGNNDAALEHFERALQIYEEIGMGQTPEAANALMNLGLDARQRGNFDEARRHYAQVGEIVREQLGPEHPHMGSLHNSIGNVYFEEGNAEAAEIEFRTSVEILRKLVPANHPALGHPINNIGEFMLQNKRYAEAVESFTEAATIWESSQGKAHPLVAYPLSGRGVALLELGKIAAARKDLERAFEIRKDDPPGVNKSRSMFGLARAVADEDPTRAEELARLALEGLGPELEERAEIEAWLADRGSAI
jgi:tetratricopeptide (TPR) repeat protein